MKRNDEAMKQAMDLKRLILCLQGKIWLFLMLTVVGAALGAGIYQVARAMNMPITYEAVSKLYISFGVDESGEIYQYYNGYTWNELLDTDPIVSCMEEFLPKEYSKEELIHATQAEILSDIRLLTVTVQGSTEKFVREMQSAVENGLIVYGQESEELKRIEVIRTLEPERVYWDDRTMTACIIGAVIMAVLTILILLIRYILDESVYVPTDIEKKYTCKALGVMPRSQKGLQPYARELRANVNYCMGENRKFVLLDMDNHSDVRCMELEKLLNAGENEMIGGDGEMGGLTWTLPRPEGEEKREGDYEILPINESVVTEEDCVSMRQNGVVIMVPFGVDLGRKTARVLSFLKNQDCPIKGMIISLADEDFLAGYFD